MATNVFTGGAQTTAQVNTVTPAGSPTIGNIFTLTCNGKTINFTATASTVANVTAGLTALVNASSIAEFNEVTAVDNTTTLTLTANTPGTPFTITSSAAAGSGGGSPTLVSSTTTANSGPADWSVAANWSLNAVPISTNDVVIDNTNQDISFGLDQNAVTLASLTITGAYTGKLGLPVSNLAGYPEYRPTYLKISATTVKVGQGPGGGSSRIKLNLGSVQSAVNVYSTGSPADVGVEALLVIGTHASNVLNIFKGSVGIAVEPSQVATFVTVVVAYTTQPSSDVTARFGSGVTLTTFSQYGGTTIVNSAVTTMVMRAGQMTFNAGTLGTLTALGGTLFYCSSGTITTVVLSGTATLDFSQNAQARVVSSCTMNPGTSYLDPFSSTVPVTIALNECLQADVVINSGFNRTLAIS